MCSFVNINRVIEKEIPLDRFEQKATMPRRNSAMSGGTSHNLRLHTGTEKSIH